MTLFQTIQDRLRNLPGEGVFTNTVKDNADTDPGGCIKMIAEQACNNYSYAEQIFGREVLELIEKFLHNPRSIL